MKSKTLKWSLIAFLVAIFMSTFIAGGTLLTNNVTQARADGDSAATNVAKVGDTEYATIDEAITNWTNNTTLTLLSDVTLSDVITLKSTEHHILNLGTYTMTAASGKNAFVIQACGTGSSEQYAITINADATNPGGINADNKCIVYYKYADGGISTEDRPIIKINGGVFTGSTSSIGTAGIYTIGTAARKCATLNISGGTFNCSIYGSGKSKLIISGGTFNYSVGSQGDSTANRLISGGTFKSFGFMTADSNNTKFWIGTSMGNSNVGVYIDDNGYIVVGGPVVTEAGEKFVASSANYSGASSYLQYSSAKDNGLYYTSVEEALADNNKTTGEVTVYVEELNLTGTSFKGTIVVPENSTLKIINAPEDLKVTNTAGKELVPIDEGTYTTVNYAAKIGDNYYETLAAALEAAQANDTIELVNNYAVTETVVVDKKVTLDLNGYELTNEIPVTETTFHTILNKGNLTVIDSVGGGKIQSNNAKGYVIYTEGGSLTVDDAKIVGINQGYAIVTWTASDSITIEEGTVIEGRGAVYIDGGATGVINGGTFTMTVQTTNNQDNVVYVGGTSELTINGGAFSTGEITGAQRIAIAALDTSKVTINDGTFFGLTGDIQSRTTAGNVVVNGGTFNGTKIDERTADSVAIKDGTFKYDPTAWVADGYAMIDNGDGTYGIKRKTSAHFESGAYASNTPSKPREHLGINVYDVYAEESLVIKMYSNGVLIAEATYRDYDLDAPGIYRYPLTAKSLTSTFVVSGKEAGSWENTWYVAPSVAYIPDSYEVYVDDILMDTWTEGGFNSEAELNDYIALPGVYKAASVTDTNGKISYYATLEEAIIAAAPAGTVEILTDITVETWKMFWQGDSTFENIIYIDMNGLTINGNGHTLTVNNIVSSDNGNQLFKGAEKLNVNNLTINVVKGNGGISLQSGTISNVTFVGGTNGVLPGTGEVTIEDCTFKTKGTSIYFEGDRDDLVVTRNTFDNADGAYAILLRGDVKFTDNTITTGKVNVVNGSPVVTRNDFDDERFKVYNTATATIENNTINNLEFNDTTKLKSTFSNNELSNAAQAKLTIALAYRLEGTGTETDPYLIAGLEDLKVFRDAVNSGNNYKGKYIKLNVDIDLTGGVATASDELVSNWTPIGTADAKFEGTFDGNGKTVSNLIINDSNSIHIGFFGYVANATIKNLNIKNVTLLGKSYVAAIAGMAYTGTIDNCHVSGKIEIEGNYCVGGIAGAWYANVKNSSVVGNGTDTSYIKGVYAAADLEGDNVAGIMANGAEKRTVTNCSVKNVTIVGTRKVGAIIGSTNRASTLANCSVENVVIGTNATADYANANTSSMTIGGLIGHYYGDGIGGTVSNCTVKDVTFTNENNVSVNAGPIVGGNRTTPNAEFTGVTASGNKIYNSTITGATNTYLMTAVAQIGEIKYYLLADAFAVANDGDIITLLADVTENITIQDGADITLDLNGKTLNGYIAPCKPTSLTVKNGSIKNTDSSKSAIEVNAGKLTLTNVNIKSARHAIRIDGAVTATIDGGTYKLIPSSKMTHFAVNVSGGATVTIEDGTFTGPAGTISDSGAAVKVQTGSTVTINGGNFSGGKNNTLSADGTLTVYGGTYDQNPSAYVASGYFVVNNNNVYTVALAVAKVGETYYATLEETLKAVTDNSKVELLTDITISDNWDCRNNGAKITASNVTIDGKGHTLTLTGAVKDNNWNTVFRFEQFATVQNLTIDVSEATDVQRGISAKLSIDVINCTFIGNGTTAKRAIIYGEGAGTAISGVEVQILSSTFKNWSYGVSDNQNAQDAKYVDISNCKFENANVLVSASDNVYFDNNTMDGGYVNISSYTVPNELVVRAMNTKVDSNKAAYNKIVAKTINNAYGFLTPVAEVEGKLYITLAEAIKAADGKTITLVKDVTLTEGLTVAAGKTITLDLNGKTVTMNVAATETSALITNNGTLTIKDSAGKGKLTYVSSTVSTSYTTSTIINNGTLTVESGTIENTSGRGGAAYAINSSNTLTVNGGTITATYTNAIRQVQSGAYDNTVTVNGGTIKGGYAGLQVHILSNAKKTKTEITGDTTTITGGDFAFYTYFYNIVDSSNTTVVIENGTFTGDVYIYNGNKNSSGLDNVSITGGTFGETYVYTKDADGNEIPVKAISGGTFANDVNEYCAVGYMVVANEDDTYGVVEDPAYGKVAKIGDTYYETLADALAAAVAGDTVTILAGEYTTNLAVEKAITVVGETDVDGKNLVNINGGISITADVAAIKNLTASNPATTGYNMTLDIKAGNVWVEGCEITDHNALRYSTATGKVTFKDCVLTGDVYGIHFDGSDNGEIVIEGCVITGWTSFASTIGSVTIEDTEFKVGAYNQLRLYQNATLTNVTVPVGMTIDSGNNGMGQDGITVTATDCKVSDGSKFADVISPNLVGKADSVTVDGNKLTVNVSIETTDGMYYYYTLADAIEDADNGDVLKILVDITLTEGVIVPADKIITLDLNGKTVSMSVAATETSALITNNGTLTIKDTVGNGKLTYVSSTLSTSYSTSTIINNGTLTVESGTIENTSARGGAAYAIDSYNTLTVNGGTITATYTNAIRQVQSGSNDNTVTVNGGTIEGGYAGLQVHILSNAKTTTNITGGTITGEGYAFYTYFYNIVDSSNTEIKVSGGTFDGDVYIYNGNKSSYGLDNVSITGGTFNGETYVYTKDASGNQLPVEAITGGTFANDVNEYCAIGYKAVENDGYFKVERFVRFVNTNLTIGADLTVNFYLNLTAEEVANEAYVSFNFPFPDSTEAKIVYAVEENKTDYGYLFSFEHVCPQQMGDIIEATLYIKNGDVYEAVDYKEYSVAEYCYKVLEMNAEELKLTETQYDAFITLVKDLLNYGAAAQNFRNYNTENLVNSGIEGGTIFVELKENDYVVTGDDAVKVAGIDLWFNNSNKLRVVFNSTTDVDNINVIILKGGRYLSTAQAVYDKDYGMYYVETEDILATDFEAVYTIMFINTENAQTTTVTCSVKSYVYLTQEGVAQSSLVQALWNYGESASKYYALMD